MAEYGQKAFLTSEDEKSPDKASPPVGQDSSQTSASECAPIQKLADVVVRELDADVYLYSGGIDDSGFGKLASALTLSSTKKQTALLILVTNGGIANSAYQIARLMQKSYKEFILYTPSYCKSAGTLIALGAHRLIMDPFSELGPLDVQLLQPNELAARKAGLISRSAFEGLKDESFKLFQDNMLSIIRRSGGHIGFKLASELSAQICSALMAPVYAQLNPDIIGSDKRDLEVAFHYGARLVSHSSNADLDTVYHLINHYPSHAFIIDFDEASDLCQSVEMPSRELYQLVGALGDLTYNEADPTVVLALHSADSTESEKNESIDQPTNQGDESRAAAGEPHVDDDRSADRERDPEAE